MRQGWLRIVPIGVAFAVGLAGSAALFGGVWAPKSSMVPIHASWGFDLANETEVASYAQMVLVGMVTEDLGVVEDQTVFEVAVVTWLKGKTPERIRVSQTGFVDSRLIYELEDQPLMKVGGQYLLLLNAPPDVNSDVLTVMAGPLSAQPPGDDLIARLEVGLMNATWPAALRKDYEAVYRASAQDWAQAHEGFTIPTSNIDQE